jgi:hypothetical protein
MKRRRENPSLFPSGKPLALLQSGHSMVLLGSLGFAIVVSPSIEQKLDGVQKYPLQVFGLVLQCAALQIRNGLHLLGGRRIT